MQGMEKIPMTHLVVVFPYKANMEIGNECEKQEIKALHQILIHKTCSEIHFLPYFKLINFLPKIVLEFGY